MSSSYPSGSMLEYVFRMHVPIFEACKFAGRSSELIHYFRVFPKKTTQPGFLKAQHALPPTPPHAALAPVPVATIECLRANAPSKSGWVGSDQGRYRWSIATCHLPNSARQVLNKSWQSGSMYLHRKSASIQFRIFRQPPVDFWVGIPINLRVPQIESMASWDPQHGFAKMFRVDQLSHPSSDISYALQIYFPKKRTVGFGVLCLVFFRKFHLTWPVHDKPRFSITS